MYVQEMFSCQFCRQVAMVFGGSVQEFNTKTFQLCTILLLCSHRCCKLTYGITKHIDHMLVLKGTSGICQQLSFTIQTPSNISLLLNIVIKE